jgi:glutaredoxin
MLPAPSPKDSFTVYGIDGCPYCQRAKELVKTIPNAKYHDITGMRDRLRPLMIERGIIPSTYSTVPLVFKNGKFIGGLTEMMASR